MRNFDFYSPTYFVFGKDREAETGRYVKRFGGSRVLVVYGGHSAVRSGLLAQVQQALEQEGLFQVALGGVVPNPRLDKVREGIALGQAQGIDFLLGVGGGSVIDTAKAIAYGLAEPDKDVWDLYEHIRTAEKCLPVASVLTIAAAGSETSKSSVITNMENGEKRGYDSNLARPKFAIMNPELMMTLPPYQTASGIADIMAHCMERYFSHTKENELTDRLLEAVMLTMIKEGKRVMKDPSNYDARANIMWAAMVAQNNSTGVGRAQDWGTHHMDNEIGILYGASHGAGLALLFPYWMEYAMKTQGPELFVKYATRVWGCQNDFEHPEVTAREGIQRFRDFMTEIGMPATISELGGKEEDIPVMVENMFFGAPNHGNFVKLTPEIAAEIYKMAL